MVKRYTFAFRDESWFDNRICRLLEKAGAVFCFFDNDQQGYAALDAMRLSDMLLQGE